MGRGSPAPLAGFAGQVGKGLAEGWGVSGEPSWSTNLLCARAGDPRRRDHRRPVRVRTWWSLLRPARPQGGSGSWRVRASLPGLTGVGLRLGADLCPSSLVGPELNLAAVPLTTL